MAMPKGPKCPKCCRTGTKRLKPVPHYTCIYCGFMRMVTGFTRAQLDAAYAAEE